MLGFRDSLPDLRPESEKRRVTFCEFIKIGKREREEEEGVGDSDGWSLPQETQNADFEEINCQGLQRQPSQGPSEETRPDPQEEPHSLPSHLPWSRQQVREGALPEAL